MSPKTQKQQARNIRSAVAQMKKLSMRSAKPKTRSRNLPAAYSTKKQRGAAPVARGLADGTSLLKYSERWFAVDHNATDSTVTGSHFNFSPGNSGMPWLDQYGRTYDQYRIRSVRLEYKPAVGTTTDGLLTLGVDYDCRDTPAAGYTRILAPRTTGPVYELQSVKIDAKRAQKASWMYCTSSTFQPTPASAGDIMQTAFAAVYDVEASGVHTYGSVWCHYDIEFCGPQVNQGNEIAPGFEAVAAIDFNGNGAAPGISLPHTEKTLDYGTIEAPTAGGAITGGPGTNSVIEWTIPSLTEADYFGMAGRLYRIIVDFSADYTSGGFTLTDPNLAIFGGFDTITRTIHKIAAAGAYVQDVQRWEFTGLFDIPYLRAVSNTITAYFPLALTTSAYDLGLGFNGSIVPLAKSLLAITNSYPYMGPTSLSSLVEDVEEEAVGGGKIRTIRHIDARMAAKYGLSIENAKKLTRPFRGLPVAAQAVQSTIGCSRATPVKG